MVRVHGVREISFSEEDLALQERLERRNRSGGDPGEADLGETLDSLLEVMGDDIAKYLAAIMERLAALLETAPTPVKSTIVGAIGSAAHASKAGFLPYFQ